MSISCKSLAIGPVISIVLACGPCAFAQPQQAPPQTPQAQTNNPLSPMRDFQQMIEKQRAQVRERVAGAMSRIEGACREELRNFCSTVTPGEGRLLLCMQAHEDKLSNQCELALFDASRNLQQTMQRISRVAEACWSDIETQCAGESSIVRCISDNRARLSPRCQAAAAELRPASPASPQEAPRQPSLAGAPIYSADGVKVGEVTAVKNGLDGKPQMIQADIGSRLGLGTTPVLITPDEFEARSDGLQLHMRADQIEAALQEQLAGQRQ
jgi:PRC-barrel domain